jgi:hypothetical protein
MWLPLNEKYELSVRGEVRNKTTQRILKHWSYAKTYSGVFIGKKHYVHHLVAKKFLPAPTKENCVIDHIDRNRRNNHASNLRWVSYSENATNKTIRTKTSLGENHHIQIRECESNSDYIVKIVIAKQLHYAIFHTLEEARKFRDDIINNSEYKEKSVNSINALLSSESERE